MFRQPTDPAVSFIKRVVGLPGDRIQVKSGLLHINDVRLSANTWDSLKPQMVLKLILKFMRKLYPMVQSI